MGDVVYGIDCKLYYKAAAHAAWVGVAGLTELGNCRNVTLTMTSDEADTTTRTNNGWKANEPTLKSAQIEFEMVWDNTDDGFTAFMDAWINRTKLSVACLTGSTAGSKGLWAACKVFSFTREEPLEGVATAKVVIKPCFDAVAPAIVTVAA